jgi:hypothetical protein
VWFDVLIFVAIFANSATMASMNMREESNGSYANGLEWFENACTVLFTVEAAIKVVDAGFWFEDNTYLASGWNQFDFLLLLGSLASLFLTDLGSQFLALRSFRCFRPLRAMKNFRDGQLLMRTTIASAPLLRDALIFLGWFLLVAAVSGTMLFGGKLTGRCAEGLLLPSSPPTLLTGTGNVSAAAAASMSVPSAGVVLPYRSCPLRSTVAIEGAICDPLGRGGVTCDDALGEVCCQSAHNPIEDFLNFDNFGRSIMIVLQIITIDGWNELAVAAADASGPLRVNLFFGIVVIFGGFYVLQLFTSVMIITLSHCTTRMESQEAEAKEREALGLPPVPSDFDLQDDKVGELFNWIGVGIGRGILQARTRTAYTFEQGEDGVRVRRSVLPAPMLAATKRMQQLVEHDWFQRVVLGVICLNTVTMAADHHGATEEFRRVVSWLELGFTSAFIAEFTLKHVAYGPVWYWTSPWNVMDGVIVVSGVLELTMGGGAQGVSMLRMLRVMRIFAGLKALRNNRAFRQVFGAIYNGAVRIVSFCLVYFLFITVFAILGMQFFGGLGDLNTRRLHFDTFGDAMLTLFVVCTGENTFNVAWDLARASGTNWAVAYMVLWSLVSTSLLALVLGVLIQAAAAPLSDYADADTNDRDLQDGGQTSSTHSFDGSQASDASVRVPRRSFKAGTPNGYMFRATMFLPTPGMSAGDVQDVGETGHGEARGGGSKPTVPVPAERLNGRSETLQHMVEQSVKDSQERNLNLSQGGRNADAEVAAVRMWLIKNQLGGVGMKSTARVPKPIKFSRVIETVKAIGTSLKNGLTLGPTNSSTGGGLKADVEEQKIATDGINGKRPNMLQTTTLVHGLAKGWRSSSPLAVVKKLESKYSTKELDEARERLITMTPSQRRKRAVEEPIQFSLGHTQSRVVSMETLLKNKSDERDAALAAEAEAVKEDPAARADRLMHERALEVGIDPEVGRVRLFCLRLTDHSWFQTLTMTLIGVSSALLAPECDVNWPAPGSATEQWVDSADLFLTAAFAAEMALKMMALTVYSGPKAYLKDSWNCLDGFIVAMSVLTYMLSSFGGIGRVLKAFRVLRVLRPLRMIKTIPSLKLVIDATLVSLPSVLTVCALGLIIMVIAGVLGMNLFGGMFWSCSLGDVGDFSGTKAGCLAAGGEWQNAPFNFDNIGQASVSVFVMSTGDNWQDLMWQGTDATGMDKQPLERNSPLSAFYFVAVVILAYFFWANLFVSALVDNFSNVASELKGSAGATGSEGYNYSESQRKWLQALNIGLEKAKESWRDVPMRNVSNIRWLCLKLRKWKRWDMFVMFFITCNALQMCLMRHGAPEKEVRTMGIFSIVFTCLYVLETAINITAMEWAAYWDSSWHKVDFVVTILGVLELAADLIGGSGGFITVFRTARFFRLFKVLKTSRGLRSLVNTFQSALPGVLNIMMLMALLVHIYACLGCTLYGSIAGPYHGVGLTRYTNFTDWRSATSLLFVVLSGNWADAFQDVYWTCATETPDPVTGAYPDGCSYRWSAVFYFFSFVILGICLLCNLFVAILLERFDYASTMEGVYDEQNPFDMMRRLTIIRRFAYKVRNRLKMVKTLRNVEELNSQRETNADAPGLRKSLNARIMSISAKSLDIGGNMARVDEQGGQDGAESDQEEAVSPSRKRKIRAALTARMCERHDVHAADVAAWVEEALEVMEEHLSAPNFPSPGMGRGAGAGAGARPGTRSAANTATATEDEGKPSIRREGGGGGERPGSWGGEVNVMAGRSDSAATPIMSRWHQANVLAAAAAVNNKGEEEEAHGTSAPRGSASRKAETAAPVRMWAGLLSAMFSPPPQQSQQHVAERPLPAPADPSSQHTPHVNLHSQAETTSEPAVVERCVESLGRWGQVVAYARRSTPEAEVAARPGSSGIIGGLGSMVGTLGSLVLGATKRLTPSTSIDGTVGDRTPSANVGDGGSETPSRTRHNDGANDARRSVKNVGRMLSQQRDVFEAGEGPSARVGQSPRAVSLGMDRDRGGHEGTGLMLERFIMADSDPTSTLPPPAQHASQVASPQRWTGEPLRNLEQNFHNLSPHAGECRGGGGGSREGAYRHQARVGKKNSFTGEQHPTHKTNIEERL